MGDRIEPSSMDCFLNIQFPHLSLIIPEIKKSGSNFEIVDWQDQDIDWSKKDKVILGPVWGYTNDINEFSSWLDLVEKSSVKMTNSATFLKWDLKKNYLLDLQNGGIRVPSTMIVEPSSELSFEEVQKAFYEKYGKSDLILKGVIDAGGFGYMHVRDFKDAGSHFEELKKNNHGVIVQEFIPEVSKKGELSFVFFGDELSHFYLKVPAYEQERVQAFYGGKSFHLKDVKSDLEAIKSTFRKDLQITETEIFSAKEDVLVIYQKLMLLLDEKQIPRPKYLRIDGVFKEGSFFIMELEGIEPYLEMKEAMEHDPENLVLDRYFRKVIEN